MSNLACVAPELTLANLRKLFSGEILALHIPGFINNEVSLRLAQLLRPTIQPEESESSIYLSEQTPFFNAVENTEKLERYLACAVPWMRENRNRIAQNATPADKIRLELDEIWPSGCTLFRLNGRSLSFGVVRVWSEDSEALPHQDVLRRELKTPFTSAGQGQLGINVYLRGPDSGGEIEIWPIIVSDAEVVELGIRGSYGYSRTMLGEPAVRIMPKTGDLVALNSYYVHAIRRVTQGSRITCSGFVGTWGEDEPLRVWS